LERQLPTRSTTRRDTPNWRSKSSASSLMPKMRSVRSTLMMVGRSFRTEAIRYGSGYPEE